MRCPKCGIGMEKLAYEALEVDQCPACHGVWLDKGELDEVLRERLGAFLDGRVSAFGMYDHDEVPARCRRCDRDMLALDGADDVRFDWCENCEGLFFDHGELTAIERFEPD